MRAFALTILSGTLTAGRAVFGVRCGYEAPPYAVLETLSSGVEVREYQDRVVVEATVDASPPRVARDRAFRLLFNYISGKNRPKREVSMTTPVETTDARGTIAMTAPVETLDDDGGYRMRFFLPADISADAAPEPIDPRVRVATAPAETLAVVRFSGDWSPVVIRTQRETLIAALAQSDWVVAGEPRSLFYDPPFTLPFLRRNEVVVPVSRQTPRSGRPGRPLD